MVFQELLPSQAHKSKGRSELESELFGESGKGIASTRIRHNEGEAAEYGVYFDDSEYDYMQHMRGLNSGDGNGESYFLEAPGTKEGKGKTKMSLEDALRDASLDDGARKDSAVGSRKKGPRLLDEEILPSSHLSRRTYQDQQDVPDVLAGFQPDMDPRLREVLEALEDEAYVDNEDDFFGKWAQDGKEVSVTEFEELGFREDDGWETDDTVKPSKEFKTAHVKTGPGDTRQESTDIPMEDSDWMREFGKFKNAAKARKDKAPSHPDRQSSVMTGTSFPGGRRKKRKGAMTSSTGYSMTSSSLVRTEGLTLLDARFDKIEEDYAEDYMDDEDGGSSVITGTSKASSQALPLRVDFDSIMDEFLDGYSMSGRKRIKKGKNQTGMEQLDEIRKELGPAKIRA